MSKSDTWPGGVAMQSPSNLDSAGSCDSVISRNSGYSQDSMEHLSPEERACLMYLEEMIEALEVQEDSGLSNDEPDPPFQAGRGVNDVSSLNSDASGKDQTSEPGSRVFFIEDQAEHQALNRASEPPTNLMTQPKPPVTEAAADFKIQPSASQLCVSKKGDGQLQIVPIASLCPDPSNEASEIDVIPPPSDFMDEPVLPPHRPSVKNHLPPSARLFNDKPGAAVDLEKLRQRASSKKTSVSSLVTQNHPKLSLPALSSDLPMSPPPEEPEEPRTPPTVAPKPKKLPGNIILKSHKGAVAVSDDNSEHSMPASSDRLLLDPRTVRIEALRKLGLLPADADPGSALSPILSPKSRKSWAGHLSPDSPRALHTSLPSTPSNTSANSPPPAWAPFQSLAAMSSSATSTAPAVRPADVLPAPAAFSDSAGPPLSANGLSAVEDASVATPPRTPTSLIKHLIPPKDVGFKSATLCLSNFIAHQDSTEAATAGQLHKNKARPASLGSRNKFKSAAREGSPAGRATGREPETRRSLPAHPRDSEKLPRGGISVLICPRAENGVERREALKKLGLLRD